jgi:C4-type Zn-finger protein
LFLQFPEAHSERGTYRVTCPVCNTQFTMAVDLVPFFNCW